MSKEILKEVCESFGITEEEYLKAKKVEIEKIMEFSGIDDTYRSGIIISRDDHMKDCHPTYNIIDIDSVRAHRR